jgi:hypothetical protein
MAEQGARHTPDSVQVSSRTLLAIEKGAALRKINFYALDARLMLVKCALMKLTE